MLSNSLVTLHGVDEVTTELTLSLLIVGRERGTQRAGNKFVELQVLQVAGRHLQSSDISAPLPLFHKKSIWTV